jgi:hypothetical protein
MDMIRGNWRLCLGLIVAASGCGGFASSPHPYGSEWSTLSLNRMVDKYGAPDRIESKRVVWLDKGPWKRIAVWDGMDNYDKSAAAGYIEQTVAYLVPPDRRDAVDDFRGRVAVSADGSELSARSTSEARNLLALNLADEIIRGVRTPGEAKSFYAATLRLADAGKSSPYVEGLLFQPLRPAAPRGREGL